jgi:hypothetical protein
MTSLVLPAQSLTQGWNQGVAVEALITSRLKMGTTCFQAHSQGCLQVLEDPLPSLLLTGHLSFLQAVKWKNYHLACQPLHRVAQRKLTRE